MSGDLTLTDDDLNLPDEELGQLLLALVIAAEARSRGVPLDQLSEVEATEIVEAAKYAEATKAKNSSVQIVTNKAAAGDFAAAGRLLKEHVSNGAVNLSIGNHLVIEIAKQQTRRKAGGAASAQGRRWMNEERDRDINEFWDKLLAEGKDPRSIAGILAKSNNLSSHQIRRIRRNK